jgi:hypothetical protein
MFVLRVWTLQKENKNNKITNYAIIILFHFSNFRLLVGLDNESYVIYEFVHEKVQIKILYRCQNSLIIKFISIY